MWQDFLPLTLVWCLNGSAANSQENSGRSSKSALEKTLWVGKEDNRKKTMKAWRWVHLSSLRPQIQNRWKALLYLMISLLLPLGPESLFSIHGKYRGGKENPFFSSSYNPTVHFWVNKPNKTALFNWYSPFIYQDNLLADWLLANLEHQVQSFKRGCLPTHWDGLKFLLVLITRLQCEGVTALPATKGLRAGLVACSHHNNWFWRHGLGKRFR